MDYVTKEWTVDIAGKKYGALEIVDRNLTDGHVVGREVRVLIADKQVIDIPLGINDLTLTLVMILAVVVVLVALLVRRGRKITMLRRHAPPDSQA